MSEPVKEVATTEEAGSTEIAAIEGGAWGAGIKASQEDLIIGRLLLMQPQNKPVIKGTVPQGTWLSSLDDKQLGQRVDVIVFDSRKAWVVSEDGKWKETFSWTPENAKLEWNDTIGGKKIKRSKAIDWYCLVADDTFGKALPVVVRMKGTSYKVARKLSTLFATWANEGKPSASKVITLSAHQEENEDGIFYVMDFEVGRNVTPAEMKVAYDWYKRVQSVEAKIDERDLENAEGGEDSEVDFM